MPRPTGRRCEQAASPLAFMVVDAQVVDRNVIRLDTENVLDVALSPSAALVDPSRPVRVVWNGVSQVVDWQQGKLRLAAPGYAPAVVHKDGRLPGTMADFTVTPFAVVIGTVSKDPEMVALCAQKARAFIDGWRDWQRAGTPRLQGHRGLRRGHGTVLPPARRWTRGQPRDGEARRQAAAADLEGSGHHGRQGVPGQRTPPCR